MENKQYIVLLFVSIVLVNRREVEEYFAGHCSFGMPIAPPPHSLGRAAALTGAAAGA